MVSSLLKVKIKKLLKVLLMKAIILKFPGTNLFANDNYSIFYFLTSNVKKIVDVYYIPNPAFNAQDKRMQKTTFLSLGWKKVN